MLFRQLHPSEEVIDGPRHVAAALSDLRVRDPEPLRGGAPRPWVLANFIASADGRGAFGGRSSALGDDGDRQIFHTLREGVDAIVAGTATLGAERYGRMIADPDRRARRLAAGRPAEPIACLVTRSGRLPAAIPLWDEPDARIILFTAAPVDTARIAGEVEVVRCGPRELSLAGAIAHLRAAHDVRLLLCEGGPTIAGAFLREGALDELYLSLAPKLAGGGESPSVTRGAELPEPHDLELVSVLERAGTLFLRYRL